MTQPLSPLNFNIGHLLSPESRCFEDCNQKILVTSQSVKRRKAPTNAATEMPQPLVYISESEAKAEATSAQTLGKSPMQDPSYLLSPIETLAASLQDFERNAVTIHDVTEAYSTLCIRIRAHITPVSSANEDLHALMHLKTHSSSLTDCLTRDIRGALTISHDSLDLPRREASFYSNTSFSLPDKDIQESRNLAAGCHHALRFASIIFAFPTLYSKFTERQLLSILRDILSIVSDSQIPTPNAQKTTTLALWILQSQKLPWRILAHELPQIVNIIKRVIDEGIGCELDKLSAFKAVNSILSRHASQSLAQFSALLPLVLAHLTSDCIEQRLDAASALCGFALAKIDTLNIMEGKHASMSKEALAYLDGQTTRKNAAQEEVLLPATLEEALSNNEQSWNKKGPSWVLTVISCLAVIADAPLYSRPRSLKLFFSTLRLCAGHKLRAVKYFQPEVWKVAVWLLSRISCTPYQEIEGDTIKDTYERAYLVLEQELNGGIAYCLVAALLNQPSPESQAEGAVGNVSKAIAIARNLVTQDERKLAIEGLMLISRFTSSIGIANAHIISISTQNLFSRVLVNGSLLTKSSNILGETFRSIKRLHVDQIRPLSENEINNHWQEITYIWILAVQKSLPQMIPEISNILCDIWQALLLVQTQLTQGHQHLTTPSPFSARVASIVTQFITRVDSPTLQIEQLSFVKRLWKVMKNVFEQAWLSTPAEIILAGILKRHFNLEDIQVRLAWSELCAELISVGVPTVLHVLYNRSESQEESQQELEVTRQLWSVLGTHGKVGHSEQNWGNLVSFLVIPFGVWILNDAEIQLWETLFHGMLLSAKQEGISENDVLSYFDNQLGEDKRTSLSHTPQCLLLLFSKIIQSSDSPLCIDFLPVVNETLISLYSTSAKPIGLPVLHLLGEAMIKIPSSEVISALSRTQGSLCLWIQDESRVLEDAEHTQLIKVVYCRSLDALAKTEPSIPTLETLESLLISVFSRITTPAVGPLAFMDFWRKSYHTDDNLKKRCPGVIRACLKAWSDIRDDSLGDDISLGSSSPSTVNPDSRSSPLRQHIGGAAEPDLSRYPDPEGSSGYNMASRLFGSPATPVQSHSHAETPRPSTSRALQALQDYVSTVEQSASVSPSQGNVFKCQDRQKAILSTGTVGSSGHEQSSSRAIPKRNRTESDLWPKPRAGKERAHRGEEPEPSRPPKRAKTTSEPATQVPSFSSHHPPQSSKSSRPEIEPPDGDKYLPPSSDDYTSWEAGLSPEDVVEIERNRFEKSDDPFAKGDRSREDDEMLVDRSPHSEDEDDDDANDTTHADILLSPSLTEFPSKSRIRYRSRTAPELTSPAAGYLPIPRPSPLRRHQTSSAQLDALQQAYAAVADTEGASQIPVHELMQARRIANQINQVLDEQMCRKLVKSEDEM